MNRLLVGVLCAPFILAAWPAVAAAASDSAKASFPGDPGRIAFMSTRDGDFDIYTMTQNGKDVPANAVVPYSTVAGPRCTSIRSTSLRS